MKELFLRFHKSIIFIFLMILLVFPVFNLSATDWATIIENAGPGIAKIILKDSNGTIISQGTGFAVPNIDGRNLLISNAHVVKEAQYDSSVSITVHFLFNWEENNDSLDHVYTGSIDLIDTFLDLCAIRLNKPAPAVLNFNTGEQPQLMSEIVVAGYPLGKNFKATPGFIQAFQTIDKMGRMLDLSSDLAPGNSGGPIMDSQGLVIGIATATIPGYNFNLAIPVVNLQNLLQGDSQRTALNIDTSPLGARVFIDGDYKGKTPLSLSLFNKEYKLRIEKDGFAIIEESVGPWSDNSSQEISLALNEIENMNPQITIITEPEGAEIFVNNRFIGESPITMRMSEGRILRIRVKKRRYDESHESYIVTGQTEQLINITLIR